MFFAENYAFVVQNAAQSFHSNNDQATIFTVVIYYKDIPAEWRFHATAHGKGPCDGIRGNLKRLAARASLQASSKDPIVTADASY